MSSENDELGTLDNYLEGQPQWLAKNITNTSNGMTVQFDFAISLTTTMNAILSDTAGRSASGYLDGACVDNITSSYITANLAWETPGNGYVRVFVIGK